MALTDSLRHAFPYAQLARDPVHPHPGAAQLKNPPRHVVGRDWPTQALTLSAGSVEPGTRALNQHRALEFGKDAGHPEQRPTGRRGCVDTLLVEVEVYARLAQRLKAFHEFTQRTTKTGHVPGKQDLETPPRRVLQHAVVSRPASACGSSGRDLRINLDDYPPSPIGDVAKALQLIVSCLLVRGYASEDGHTAHR
jgi:hypothetical protein